MKIFLFFSFLLIIFRIFKRSFITNFFFLLYAGAARLGGGGYPPPALENFITAFSDFGRKSPSNFHDFGRKSPQIFSNFGRKSPSNFLRFCEKISLKFSPILGENRPRISSDFGRKYTSKRFFDPFSHFQKYPLPAFTSSRRPWLFDYINNSKHLFNRY